jgi:hypothetical protein
MASKIISMAILALLCGCGPTPEQEGKRAPGPETSNLTTPPQTFTEGAPRGKPSSAEFTKIDPPMDPSECGRMTVRDEVRYRRMVMSRLPTEFPGRTPIFQGIERCRHYVVVHFQLDVENEVKPARQFVFDELTGKSVLLGDE